jgi:hypothetical protein
MFDSPFAAVALIWLGWRVHSSLPKGERTKRIIDWLTLIPLGFMPASLVWFNYTDTLHQRPPVIWLVLSIIHIPIGAASFIWLGLRMDKIPIVHWLAYKFVMRGFLHLFFAVVLLLILMQWLWR